MKIEIKSVEEIINGYAGYSDIISIDDCEKAMHEYAAQFAKPILEMVTKKCNIAFHPQEILDLETEIKKMIK